MARRLNFRARRQKTKCRKLGLVVARIMVVFVDVAEPTPRAAMERLAQPADADDFFKKLRLFLQFGKLTKQLRSVVVSEIRQCCHCADHRPQCVDLCLLQCNVSPCL